MNRVFRHVRAAGRAIVRAIRVLLILALVLLPLPMAALIAAVFVPKREDPSAEVIRDDARRS